MWLTTIFIILITTGGQIGLTLFNNWKKSLLEAKEYKLQTTAAQLKNLKSQLNPHFLFNNLSVLTSLVYTDQDKAAAFISELADVYRYLLKQELAELVTLNEECRFLNHYMYLLQMRFGQNLSFKINIENAYQDYLLPPLCLQVLVENTIQHNEASQDKPLTVSIFTDGPCLVIENTIQPRSDNYKSTKLGLTNISARYGFFTDKPLKVSNHTTTFRVELPLLKTS
jgi:LytS/YehU family sensor histidine kinase